MVYFTKKTRNYTGSGGFTKQQSLVANTEIQTAGVESMTSEVDVLHKTTRQDNTYGDGSNPVMPYLGGCTSMYGYHFL
jgi:hypothetical protein